jgi:hypothetical protein
MSVRVARGCPQRGVLSPLQWYLFVDELIARLNEGVVYIQGNEDDTCLLVVKKSQIQFKGLYKGPFIL